MASQSTRPSVPKLCPRCGAFYQDLSSKTCPQCFAKLEELDDNSAAALVTEQERRAGDPEILRSKSVDDEHFKEQAFGACMSVVGITVLTMIICIVVIVVGAHRYHSRIRVYADASQISPVHGTQMESHISLPQSLDGSVQKSLDTGMVLPGSLCPVLHATYFNGDQVYCVKAQGLTDDQIAGLRLAVSFAAKQHAPELVQVEIPGPSVYSIILAPNSDDARKAATEIGRLSVSD